MKKNFLTVSIAALALATFTACGGGSSGGTDPSTGTALKGYADCTPVAGEAVICGTVRAADSVTPIVGAEIRQLTASGDSSALRGIYVTDAGPGKGVPSNTACRTDGSGSFACGGITENGTYTFSITAQGISISFSLTVAVDGATTADGSDTTATTDDMTEKWLVVMGSWDGVQALLAELKGCTLDGTTDYPTEPAYWTASSACTAANLDVIEWSDVDTKFSSLANLSDYDAIFINCGTDMASYSTVIQEYVAGGGNIYFSDLSDPGLTAAFPDKITYGDNYYTYDGSVTADIDNAELATFLGSPTMSVEFNLGGWMPIASVASGVTTYISGDTSSIGGTADAPITVGWKEGTGGCVFYTSYHIEGAATGSAQEKALKYLILNIDSVCQ